VSEKPVHRPSQDYPIVGIGRNSFVPSLLLVILVLLKVPYAFWLRIDSDETQHLHVVWGWANGLLPY
jgi:hypothetical protein